MDMGRVLLQLARTSSTIEYLRHRHRPATRTATSQLSTSPLRLTLLIGLIIASVPLTPGGARCQRDSHSSSDRSAPRPAANNYSDSSIPVEIDNFQSSTLISFVANYTSTSTAWRRHTDDTCRSFKALNLTISDISSHSSPTSVHLTYIVKTMHSACTADQGDIGHDTLECFQHEVSSILWRSCQQRLSFNANQRTHPYCYFVQEAANCKVALVTSSCGADAGQLAYHMIALMTSPSQVTCHVRPLTDRYRGFRYDANCPAYFVDDLELCAIKHIYSQNSLEFRTDNDLVAMTTDRASITDACRTYREYKLCVRPINKACRRGVRLVYAHLSALRLYRLKMDFICAKTNRQHYIRQVNCYHTVLQSAAGGDVVKPSLRHCNRYWQQRVRPVLGHVTAHRFYCDVTANDTVSLSRKLVRLTGCYERVFRHQCGLTAGRLVAGLMKRAFADPHYQRYRYRPDCYLHRRRRRPTLSGRPRSSDQHCRGTGFAVVAAHHRAIVIALVVVSTLALVSPNSPYRISSLV